MRVLAASTFIDQLPAVPAFEFLRKIAETHPAQRTVADHVERPGPDVEPHLRRRNIDARVSCLVVEHQPPQHRIARGKYQRHAGDDAGDRYEALEVPTPRQEQGGDGEDGERA